MTSARTQTISWAEWIYGDEPVPLDDPAETYHEASAIHRSVADRGARAHLLERSPELQISATRASKQFPHLPRTELPPASLGPATLEHAVFQRKSERSFSTEELELAPLSAILTAAYGATHRHAETGHALRAVPSGGGLYPLDLYVVSTRVEGLPQALHHFDSTSRALERIRAVVDARDLAALTVYPNLFVEPAAIIFVSAMFWRTRFKYGLRGYRFALLEAGHVGQNVLLAAAALDLAAVAVGGFFDRRVNDFLELDGVNEAALYAFAIGRRA